MGTAARHVVLRYAPLRSVTLRSTWMASCHLLEDLDAGRVQVIDRTVGTDAGQAGGFDPPFPNHNIMHGAGKFGRESLTNQDKLPATGAIVIAAPLKLVNGIGSPWRAGAMAPA